MVSQNLVIVLITIAILLSVVSIAVTISTLNSTEVPKPPQVNIIPGKTFTDSGSGQVAIKINPQLEEIS